MLAEEKFISAYLEGKKITTFFTLKVDTKELETIAAELVKFDCIEELSLVTGDVDLIAKAKFNSYTDLKEFVDNAFQDIYGIKDVKVLVVMNIYKGG